VTEVTDVVPTVLQNAGWIQMAPAVFDLAHQHTLSDNCRIGLDVLWRLSQNTPLPGSRNGRLYGIPDLFNVNVAVAPRQVPV
jgi:hypothetical protein